MHTATQPVAAPRATGEAGATAELANRYLAWIAPVLAFGLIAWRRWSGLGTFPTGMDAGEWLALGRGYLGGDGRSTDGAYPPLIPVLHHLLRQVTDPMTVTKLIPVLAVVAVMAAAYLVAREGMHWWFALGVSATMGLSGTFTEAIAFGGSPQFLALAFMILAGLGLARYLAGGERKEAIWAGAALTGAAVSHHTYFPLACAAFAGVWGAWLLTTPERATLRERTIGTVIAGAVGVLAFAPTAIAFQVANYDPPVNSNSFDIGDAIGISIREAEWLWWPFFVVGVIAFPLLYRRRTNPAWQVGAAITLSSLILFSFTTEPRVLPALVVGTGLGIGLLLQELWERTSRTALGAAPLTLVATLPMLLWPFADLRADELYRHYRVMDRSLHNAINFVDAYDPEGAVLVRKTAKGWPSGWWFEGLTDERIMVGSEERWLAFDEERTNARLAEAVFRDSPNAAQAAATAREGGAQLLVFRKGEWTGWQQWLAQPDALRVIFDDGVTMIVDVGQG